ncbi:MAG: RAD55 family ATPase [Thermoplasmata archaeon]
MGKAQRVRTYVEGLDRHMEGGVPIGYTILVCGPSGSMKSTLVFNILYNASRDDNLKSLYISMEQSKDNLLGHMTSLGMDASKAKNLNVVDMGRLRRELGKKKPEDWLDMLYSQLKRYRKEFDCDLMALDSLDALYALTVLDNPRNQLFHFFEDLRELGTTNLLVSEMSRDEAVFGRYGVEEFLSDGIIHLRFREIEIGRKPSVRRYIGIVKMRGTSHDLDYYPLLVEKGKLEIVVE